MTKTKKYYCILSELTGKPIRTRGGDIKVFSTEKGANNTMIKLTGSYKVSGIKPVTI